MKTKSLFIVRTPDKNSLFNEKVRVITESTLTRDINSYYVSAHPKESCKFKHIQEIAQEQVNYLNGSSITEQEYQEILNKCVVTVYEYEHTGLLKFGEMLTVYQQVENARAEQANTIGTN